MIKTDSAIKSKIEDLLGRSKFSEAFGKALLDWKSDEGFVIGLYGQWGSGKSSVINLAVEYIVKETKKKKFTEKDKPIIIRFNPWNFTEQNQLINMFFLELAKAIKFYDSGADAKKVGQKLITYSKFFTVLSLVPGLDPYAKVVGNVFKQVGETTKDWGELQTKNLEQYKKELDKSIKKLNRKLIVIIDDIDRLTGKEIKQIFQLVKLNGNFPNTLYVLSLDQEKTLEEIEEDSDFLEKIVQVNFHVPFVDDKKLQDLLFTELDKILAEFPEGIFDMERWNDAFNAGYKNLFGSVRRINRYINSLQFTIKILSDEINPLDFFILEAIRVFFPTFYEELAKNKEIILGRFFLDSDKDRAVRKVQLEKMFEKVKDEADRNLVRRLTFELFPQVEAVYNNRKEYEADSWFGEKRICSERRFGNYFYLNLSDDELAQSEMNILCESSGNSEQLKEMLVKILNEKKIRRSLERLPEIIDTVPNENVYNFILAYFNISNRIPRERSGDLDFGVESQLDKLAYHLIKKLLAEERYAVVEKLLKNSKNLEPVIRYIALEYDETTRTDEKLLFSQDAEKLMKISLEKIKALAKSRKLDNSYGLAFILYRWSKWENEEEPKKYVDQLIQTPQGIAKLLRGFTGSVISKAKRSSRISYKDIKFFADLQTVKDKITEFTAKDKKSLSKEEQESIDIFLKDIDRYIAGDLSKFDF